MDPVELPVLTRAERLTQIWGALRVHCAARQEKKASAENPSYRLLAIRANHSGTMLSEAARGLSLPSLEVPLAYVRARGGDIAFWRRHCKESNAALDAVAEDRDGDALPGPTTSLPAPTGTEAARPANAAHNDALGVPVNSLPVLTSAAGLVNNKPKAVTLAVVAGAWVASGFWLRRGRRGA